MRKYLLLCLIVLTLPLFLGINAWQSCRYSALKQELKRLEQAQSEWVESNKRLIAGISFYSSAGRIEHIAAKELDLHKVKPENVLQINIRGGKGHGFQ